MLDALIELLGDAVKKIWTGKLIVHFHKGSIVKVEPIKAYTKEEIQKIKLV